MFSILRQLVLYMTSVLRLQTTVGENSSCAVRINPKKQYFHKIFRRKRRLGGVDVVCLFGAC